MIGKPLTKKQCVKWIEALRSGRYKQGKGALKTDDGRYCCLGVLKEELKVKVDGTDSYIACAKDNAYVCDSNVLLLQYDTQDILADMNDKGRNGRNVTFKGIAQYIERYIFPTLK